MLPTDPTITERSSNAAATPVEAGSSNGGEQGFAVGKEPTNPGVFGGGAVFGDDRETSVFSTTPSDEVLLAVDWGSREGRFTNDTGRDLFTLTDRYDENGESLGIEATRLRPGEEGQGDAVLLDNGDGVIGEGDRVFKVPNSRREDDGWTVRDGFFRDLAVRADTEHTGLIMDLAEAKKPFSNDYGRMSLDHFQRIMGDKPIVDSRSGDELRPAP